MASDDREERGMDSEKIRDLGIFGEDPSLFARIVLRLPRHRIVPAESLELGPDERVMARLRDASDQVLAVVVPTALLTEHIRDEDEIAHAREHATAAIEKHLQVVAETDAALEQTSERLEQAQAELRRAEHELHLAHQQHETAKQQREVADTRLRLALDDVYAWT
ncbi:MAG: hypothetical protein ACOCVS_01110 [Planctomycetota bacterium]